MLVLQSVFEKLLNGIAVGEIMLDALDDQSLYLIFRNPVFESRICIIPIPTISDIVAPDTIQSFSIIRHENARK